MTATTTANRKQQQAAAEVRIKSDPAVFRSIVLIDTDDGPRRAGDVRNDWQCKDDEATDPAWRRVVGQNIEPRYQRIFLERPRGHDKTTGLALMVLWAMYASPRKIDGAAFAADKDQAGLIRNAIDKILRLNSWLAKSIQCNKFEVVNVATGSTFVIQSADVATSYGLILDYVCCDEVTHWPNRDLWDSILSTIAKRRHGLLCSIANAGFQDHFAWELRETIRTDHDWYFSRLDGPVASWMSPKVLDEQRRLLPPKVYARLWLNQWADTEGSAFAAADIEAASKAMPGPQPRRMDRLYLASLDIGVKRDHTALAILAIDQVRQRVSLANLWSWNPADYGGRIDLGIVLQTILQARNAYGFSSLIYDPWQGYYLADELERNGINTIEWNFVPANRDAMARCLLESLQSRTLDLYPDALLQRELFKIRVKEAPHLGLRLEAPRDEVGGHCDRAFSLAIGCPLAFEVARHGLPEGGDGISNISDEAPVYVIRPV